MGNQLEYTYLIFFEIVDLTHKKDYLQKTFVAELMSSEIRSLRERFVANGAFLLPSKLFIF